MKKIILAALTTIIACSTQKENQARPLIQVCYGAGTIYNIGREAGELSLHQLAKTAKLEDYWIFSDNQWVDVGTNENPETVNGDYDVFRKFAKETVIECHIHPLNDRRIYPPSAKDIIRHGNLKRELKSLGISLESKLYDGVGEWAYTVTKTVEHLLSLKVFKLHQHTYEELLHELLTRAMINTLDLEYLSRHERIQKYVQEVANFGIIVNYRKLR